MYNQFSHYSIGELEQALQERRNELSQMIMNENTQRLAEEIKVITFTLEQKRKEDAETQ